MKQYKLNKGVVWFAKITGLPILLYLKLKIHYQGNDRSLKKVPKPCIIMSNHTALFDFALYLALFYFRTIRFLMAEVLFEKNPILNWFLASMGGIRVDRNAYDLSFVGEALDVLDANGTVGVFPEGRLPRGEKNLPFKPGIVYIALRTDAPIVPVYTDGNYGLFKRTNVVIGAPIYLRDYCNTEKPSEDKITQLTEMLREKTYALKNELERKVISK